MAKTKEQLFQQAVSNWENMAEKYIQKAVKKMNTIGRLQVWEWYKSYSPYQYRRKKTLYYGFKVEGGNGKIKVHFGPEDMYKIHFVDKLDPNYIFDNSFMEGFHGGARDGEDHPEPGTPYWRTPAPNYPFWGRPAIQTESPFQRIDKAFDEYTSELRDKLTADFKKKIMPMLLKALYG